MPVNRKSQCRQQAYQVGQVPSMPTGEPSRQVGVLVTDRGVRRSPCRAEVLGWLDPPILTDPLCIGRQAWLTCWLTTPTMGAIAARSAARADHESSVIQGVRIYRVPVFPYAWLLDHVISRQQAGRERSWKPHGRSVRTLAMAWQSERRSCVSAGQSVASTGTVALRRVEK